MAKVTLTSPAKNIYLLTGESQYNVSSTFMRIQEFYESPLEEIRGHFFTLEQFMDRYAEEYGDFSYTSDWDGYNVPGHVVRQFFELFNGHFLKKEIKLKNLLSEPLHSKEPFYIIGIYDEGEFAHEMSHAFYYLYPEYKEACDKLTNSLPPKVLATLKQTIKDWGYYHEDVMMDEIQAYMGTSSFWWLFRTFGLSVIPWRYVHKYRKIYIETFRKYSLAPR